MDKPMDKEIADIRGTVSIKIRQKFNVYRAEHSTKEGILSQGEALTRIIDNLDLEE